jgi:hypothetical protein
MNFEIKGLQDIIILFRVCHGWVNEPGIFWFSFIFSFRFIWATAAPRVLRLSCMCNVGNGSDNAIIRWKTCLFCQLIYDVISQTKRRHLFMRHYRCGRFRAEAMAEIWRQKIRSNLLFAAYANLRGTREALETRVARFFLRKNTKTGGKYTKWP